MIPDRWAELLLGAALTGMTVSVSVAIGIFTLICFVSGQPLVGVFMLCITASVALIAVLCVNTLVSEWKTRR